MSAAVRRPVLLDGGLATSLQPLGLARATPVDDWLHSHPDAVASVHRAFVASGAEVLLAGSFHTLPPHSGWERSLRAAVRLARSAAHPHTQVFASFGPTVAPGACLDPSHTLAAAAVAVHEGIDGLVLETFVDADVARQLTIALRDAHPSLFLATCLCPREDGQLFSGQPTAPALAALLEAGASAVGVNCGFGPHSAVAALRECPETWPLWCKPNSGDLDPHAFADVLAPMLPRLSFVGGCCGATPAHVEALRTRLQGE